MLFFPKYSKILLSAFFLLLLSSCFGGVQKTGKVVDYKTGRVLTKKGFYQVGELPQGWERISLKAAVISFRNASLQSTISTDAYCDQAYDDAPLNMLTKHLFSGLQEIKVLQEEPFMLDERGALRTSWSASLDGMPVRVEAVVIKKNWCLFDFYLVSPPDRVAEALPDFESFYRGFVYSGEI